MLKRFLEFKESDLEPIKSFRIQDELNKNIWDGDEMIEDVREQLEKISKDFYEGTDIEADVIDYTLVGSLCNYNWSEKYSDFDLHIIIDYKDVSENEEFVEMLCDLSKKVWNSQHDIYVAGYEVEVMIQNEKDLKLGVEKGKIGAVYSIKDKKWIKEPEKKDVTPDEDEIEKVGKEYMTEIDEIEKEMDGTDYEEASEKLKKVWKKIKKGREESLEKEGEYGTGNLVFKLLRRNGYIEKIIDLKTKSYDNQFK